MPVSQLAKWKTAVQMVALGALIISTVSHPMWLIEEIGLVALWIACALTLATGWDYFVIWARTLRS
jgi:phosphatidylglycerophosphate synthase